MSFRSQLAVPWSLQAAIVALSLGVLISLDGRSLTHARQHMPPQKIGCARA
jgi:hypothetical protein